MDESEKPKPKTLPIFSTEPESEEFYLGFQSQMGIHTQCEHCGRVHFSKLYKDVADGGVWENLSNAHKENSDACVLHKDSIAFTLIDGKKYVLMCVCHKGRVYEDFIWSSRHEVLDYLKRRAIDIQDEGDIIERDAGKLTDAFEGGDDD